MEIVLINNDKISLLNDEDQIYKYVGVNNEIFYLKYDIIEHYFKILNNNENENENEIKDDFYVAPNIEHMVFAYRFRNITNMFNNNKLYIVNVYSKFDHNIDENPLNYWYLLIYNNDVTILCYNNKKYSTRYINIYNLGEKFEINQSNMNIDLDFYLK
jgi:hypothetical protein